MSETTANVILAICALFSLFNWIGMISAMRASRNSQSHGNFSFAPPFVFGLVAMGVIGFYPNQNYRSYFWLPLVIDPSIGFALSMVAYGRLRGK